MSDLGESLFAREFAAPPLSAQREVLVFGDFLGAAEVLLLASSPRTRLHKIAEVFLR